MLMALYNKARCCTAANVITYDQAAEVQAFVFVCVVGFKSKSRAALGVQVLSFLIEVRLINFDYLKFNGGRFKL